MEKSKNSKKNNKIKWEDVYKKCNHNKYSEIKEIGENLELKSNCQNFVKNFGIVILILSLICLSIFIYTFRNNPLSILYCVRNYLYPIYIIYV